MLPSFLIFSGGWRSPLSLTHSLTLPLSLSICFLYIWLGNEMVRRWMPQHRWDDGISWCQWFQVTRVPVCSSSSYLLLIYSYLITVTRDCERRNCTSGRVSTPFTNDGRCHSSHEIMITENSSSVNHHQSSSIIIIGATSRRVPLFSLVGF